MRRRSLRDLQTRPMFVDVFVFRVQHVCLTLNGFDKLTVGTVALVHFREQGFFCFNVTFPSHVGYFLQEPAEDFSGYVVDRSVNGRNFETVLVILLQKRGVQKYLFCFEHSQQLLLVRHGGSAAIG